MKFFAPDLQQGISECIVALLLKFSQKFGKINACAFGKRLLSLA
jgi:hypothetical protein